MIRLGLVGWPISHSLSPELHKAAFKAINLEGEYSLYPVETLQLEKLAELIDLVRNGYLTGLNVTLPYKQTVLNMVDELTPNARKIGAVNTIYVNAGRVIGHNTDVTGFLVDLRKKANLDFDYPGKAIVLGAGGSARAIVSALIGISWQITVASRNLQHAQALADFFNDEPGVVKVQATNLEANSLQPLLNHTKLIVNTTPVGMYPKIGFSPWPDGLPMVKSAFIYDLIYNPPITMFVKQATDDGLHGTNGMGMLVEQAALSFEIWTGKSAHREAMSSVVSSLL